MRQFKTRKVTEMGRLVTRAQLQSAANQIGAHLVGGMQRLEETQAARMDAIQKRVDDLCDAAGLLRVEWPPIDAKPELVPDEPKAIELPEPA